MATKKLSTNTEILIPKEVSEALQDLNRMAKEKGMTLKELLAQPTMELDSTEDLESSTSTTSETNGNLISDEEIPF